MAPKDGASKRPQVTPAVPRVIPAIPHALNRNNREKQSSQRAQPSHSTKPTEKAIDATPTLQDGASIANVEAQPTVAPADAAALPVSDDIGTSPATADTANTPPVDQHSGPSTISKSITLADEKVPADQVDANGVQEADTSTTGIAPAEVAEQSPISPRQMRNLPPPFYPANQQSGPSSVSSAQARRDQQPTNNAAQQARPNTNSTTFGGHRDSTNSSPALPPPQAQAPAYTGYPNPSQAYPLYGVHPHGYHIPDANAGQAYNSPVSPGGQPYVYSRDYGNNGASYPPRGYNQPGARHHQHAPRRHFDAHNAQRYPPPVQNMFLPQHITSRPVDSYLEAPKALNTDAGSGRPNFPPNRFAEQQSALLPNHAGPRHSDPSAVPRMESSPTDQYLRGQFSNAEFADYVVQLSHSGYSFPPTMLPAHGVVLARSPKLRSLITMQRGSPSSSQNDPKQLSVPISDRFLNFEIALMHALMRLYGESLPDGELVSRLSGPSAYLEAGNIQAVQMRFALAFAAAGHFLQMDEIISHGLHLAESLLGWDTIGKALAFGLEGGLSPHFSQFETAVKDKESSSSVDDAPAKLDSPSSAPAYGYYSDRMLNYVVNFLVYNCPTDFTLSTEAPQMNDPPRLPAEAEPKHTRSTSRISQIRFGEMSLENSKPQSPANEKMSSVLISLPFPLLVHVLESNILSGRLGSQRVAEIMRDTIQEREIRRQRAMKCLSASAPSSAVEERLWRTVRWIESVEPNEQRPTGLKLSRQLAGNETPPSAGSITT